MYIMRRNQTVWYEHQNKNLWKETYPECSMYAYLKEAASGWNELGALYFEGKTVAFQELFQQIEAYNRAFQAVGVKQGDFVTIIAPNIPQAVYAFYALNALGAVANMLHPMLSAEEIKNAVVKTNSHIVLVLDLFAKKVAGIDWPDGFSVRSIAMYVSDALPPVKKAL